MVRHSVYPIQNRFVIFHKTPNITVELIRLLIRNSRLTIFCTKNNMIQKSGIAHISVCLYRTPCGSVSSLSRSYRSSYPKLRIGLSIVKCSALSVSGGTECHTMLILMRLRLRIYRDTTPSALPKS